MNFKDLGLTGLMSESDIEPFSSHTLLPSEFLLKAKESGFSSECTQLFSSSRQIEYKLSMPNSEEARLIFSLSDGCVKSFTLTAPLLEAGEGALANTNVGRDLKRRIEVNNLNMMKWFKESYTVLAHTLDDEETLVHGDIELAYSYMDSVYDGGKAVSKNLAGFTVYVKCENWGYNKLISASLKEVCE